ncbi:MAG TPA: DUF2399 domain-containing protein [Pyrinomonadaceae bacterium]
MQIGEALVKSVTSATSKWTKARKAAERNRASMNRYYYSRSDRITIREAAFDVMDEAYMKASANNTLPAAARQIMYQARPLILERCTSETLDANYFTQTLLPDYLEKHPDKASAWDVVFDARGHLYEPHTDIELPLGTLAVRSYLAQAGNGKHPSDEPPQLPSAFPTFGPRNRFHTVLFIEKEGFMPLLRRAQIAERYDLALMSTKGVSTTAARALVDRLQGARFLVLHDFDKAGFTIAATLKRSTKRYRFSTRPDVVDLGLRLSDVREEGLESEPVTYPKSSRLRLNLHNNGATKEEAEFLVSDWQRGIGQRVELNALASDHFITWLERKLELHGVKKLVPDGEVLAEAYRRALFVKTINGEIKKANDEARKASESAKVPKTLRRQIDKLLKSSPALAWDDALAQIVTKKERA